MGIKFTKTNGKAENPDDHYKKPVESFRTLTVKGRKVKRTYVAKSAFYEEVEFDWDDFDDVPF